MNSRRNFLKKSSLTGLALLALPQVVFSKSASAKSNVSGNFKPLYAYDSINTTKKSQNLIFSRPSSATFFNSEGLLSYANQNLLTYSQDIAHSDWNKEGCVAANAKVAAPDGSNTVNVLTESNTKGEHRISQNVTVNTGVLHTFSVHLKAGTCRKVRLSFMSPKSYTGGNPSVFFDLSNGTVTSKTTNVISSVVTDEGNGWWRVAVTANPDLNMASGFQLFMTGTSDSINYAGSGRTLFFWGAQFEAGSTPHTYFATKQEANSGERFNYDPETLRLRGLMVEPAATNLIKQSQKLHDSAVWLLRNAALQHEKFVSPDGSSKASKLVEDNTSGAHYIRPFSRQAVTPGQVYTFSVFLRAAERKWAYFNLEDATVHFDLSAGRVSRNVNPAYISTEVQPLANGWFRCSATLVAAGTVMDTSLGVEAADNVRQYSGNGAYGIYVWGPQLEASSYATSYIPTGNAPASRSVETCSLMAPSASSANDIMVQRTNGGAWVNNISEFYKVPHSRYELQTGSFWKPGTSNKEKEEISENLFPATYMNAGMSTAKLNIFGNNYRVQSPNQPHSVKLAKNKTCQQYRFQLNSGEQWSSDAGKDKERSELYSLDKMPLNQDVWLSYAVKVAPGSPVTSKFCHFGQFHATEDPGETASVPVLTFRFSGENTLSITTCANTAAIATSNTAGVYRYKGILPRGEWVRNVMRIRFSPTNGQLQWWENGVEKLNLSGVGIGNNDTVGPYWKFGIYRTRSAETLMVEYANMELSTTKSLLSRVKEPLLIV